jgi:hypothetical protein
MVQQRDVFLAHCHCCTTFRSSCKPGIIRRVNGCSIPVEFYFYSMTPSYHGDRQNILSACHGLSFSAILSCAKGREMLILGCGYSDVPVRLDLGGRICAENVTLLILLF